MRDEHAGFPSGEKPHANAWRFGSPPVEISDSFSPHADQGAEKLFLREFRKKRTRRNALCAIGGPRLMILHTPKARHQDPPRSFSATSDAWRFGSATPRSAPILPSKPDRDQTQALTRWASSAATRRPSVRPAK